MMLCDRITTAIDMLRAFTSEKTKDGELTDEEIERMVQELEGIIDALKFSLEQRQEALQAAATQGREARTEI